MPQAQTKNATLPLKGMDELLEFSPPLAIPELGALIEGAVISKSKNKVLVDIDGINIGIISGREAHDSTETFKNLKEGDKVSASVIDTDSADGLIVLSLRKASQEKTWKYYLDAFESGKIIDVVPAEANKGGLLLEADGIKGFIPVSQLAPLHYPRVNGTDTTQILQRLEKLIGLKFKAKILNIDKENGKLILSEKSAYEAQRKESLTKLKAGQKVKGRISGIVNFGIFVTFEGLEGLVHISEIAWGHVSNPAEYGRLNDDVEVLVIGIDGEKISLSMKRLTPDPWIEAAKTFKIGKMVEGEINRITQFGAFIKLNDEINGLIHLSEISNEEVSDINKLLKVGDKVKTKIITVDLDEHRIGLSIKELTKKEDKKKDVETPLMASEPSDLDSLELTNKVKKSLIAGGFDKIAKLKKVSLEELTELDGIGKKTAEKIVEKLK